MKRLAVLGLFFVLVASPGGAHVRTLWDGNDVGGPLDIERVTMDHGSGRLKFKIQMRNDFRARVLKRDANSVWVNLETRRGPQFDFFAEVKYSRGHLRTRVYRIIDRPETDVEGKRLIGRGWADLKDGDIIQMFFRKGLVRIEGNMIRWSAEAASYWKHWDQAPNVYRSQRHDLS